jgi:hypothetical protein
MILNALEGLLTKPVAKSTDTVTLHQIAEKFTDVP